jgi:hypothetical protein
VEERVLERNVRPTDVLGDPQYILGARGPELLGGAFSAIEGLIRLLF